MVTTAYSPNKPAKFPLRLVQLSQNQQIYPVHVQLILSDLCNQDCPWCAYRQAGNVSNELFPVIREDGSINHNPNRRIPREKALEIVRDCKSMGVEAIQLTGGGEPTVHPDIKEIIRAIRDAGIAFSLVSNGVLIDDELSELLMDAAWVRISIDAGTKETYSKARRVSEDHFHRAWANISKLTKKKTSAGSFVYIGVGFVVNEFNWFEVLLAGRLARDAGVDSFRVSAAFLSEGASYFDGFAEEAEELCQQAEELSTDGFVVTNFFKNRVQDLEQGSPDYQFCGMQQMATYIGADLNVYRCCTTAYNHRGKIGSIACQGLKDLWDSQEKRDDFSQFDAHGCERCQFNDKNRVINELLTVTPHDKFV